MAHLQLITPFPTPAHQGASGSPQMATAATTVASEIATKEFASGSPYVATVMAAASASKATAPGAPQVTAATAVVVSGVSSKAMASEVASKLLHAGTSSDSLTIPKPLSTRSVIFYRNGSPELQSVKRSNSVTKK